VIPGFPFSREWRYIVHFNILRKNQGEGVPFKLIVQELVQSTAGATGAILIDWEGEAVEFYSPVASEFDIKILGAHQNIVFGRSAKGFRCKTSAMWLLLPINSIVFLGQLVMITPW
jgi:hypothetical protein